FAYTCSFSVAAASVSAQTVNVDLSKKSLERGRQNFALNSVSTEGHKFIADDVRPVLQRLARRGEKFDMIILDPPTFSRTKGGKAFHVESDFEDLIVSALELIDGNARILLSTNCEPLDAATLRRDPESDRDLRARKSRPVSCLRGLGRIRFASARSRANCEKRGAARVVRAQTSDSDLRRDQTLRSVARRRINL